MTRTLFSWKRILCPFSVTRMTCRRFTIGRRDEWWYFGRERQDEHYRELAERHHQLDDRLHEFTDRHYLTTSEQLEEVTLKKRKLALKDQMEEIARDYAASHA